MTNEGIYPSSGWMIKYALVDFTVKHMSPYCSYATDKIQNLLIKKCNEKLINVY